MEKIANTYIVFLFQSFFFLLLLYACPVLHLEIKWKVLFFNIYQCIFLAFLNFVILSYWRCLSLVLFLDGFKGMDLSAGAVTGAGLYLDSSFYVLISDAEEQNYLFFLFFYLSGSVNLEGFLGFLHSRDP